MVMTSTLSPGDDPRWGLPLGGYTTFGGAPPGTRGGTPMKKNPLPWQVPGEQGQVRMNPGEQGQLGQPRPNPGGQGSGSVTTGFGLKQTPMGQYGGLHPNMVGAVRRKFGI